MKNIHRFVFAAIIFVVLALSCVPQEMINQAPQLPPKAAAPKNDKCGDGVCEGPENTVNCPADCGQSAGNSAGQPAAQQLNTATSKSSASGNGVLYIGVMVHLEGWNDGVNQQRIEEHVRLIRDYASLFETYGVRLTWESKEVTDGVLKWGDNVLLEMQQRGHGIGLHADLGGNPQDD